MWPLKPSIVSLLLTLCSVIGFLISTYFTAVSYRWIRPDSSWIPRFCHMGEQTCSRLIFTPRARVFGVPNSVLGQVFYTAVLLAVFTQVLFVEPLFSLLLSASLVTVALGAYLTYSLLFLTRVACRLCFASHAINLVIFLLFLTAPVCE